MTLRRSVIVLLAVTLLTTTMVGQNTKENADFKLAINLYNDGLYDLAAEQLRQFINSYQATPQGIEARFYLGLTQLKLKRFDDARLTFQTFALTEQDNPRAPEAWWNVGESYAALGNTKEAALAFERVKVFHPKSRQAPDALLKASRFFALAGERDNARRVLRIILQEYPTSAAVLSARTQLGQIYFEEGNLDLAQNELKRVIDGDPSPDAKAQALLILGNISLAMGKTAQAQENYEEIIGTYKTSSARQGAHLNLGRLLLSSGEYADAAENFKKAAGEKSSVDSALTREAMVGLGESYTALKDYANALAAFERFLAAFPQDDRSPEVLWKLATAAARGKNYKKSNDACARILKGPATDLLLRRARVRLALNAQEQKNPQAAVQYFEAFLDQSPDDPVAPDILLRIASVTEKDLRDPRKASTTYELLAMRHPNSAEADAALAGAGRCHEQLKEFDRALQVYRELTERFPSSELRPEVEQRIRMINTFEAKDKDAGLEKLALLVGDVVAEKDRVGLAFRLGEIYFHELKSYAAAATQFTNAINSGMSDERFVEALYFRAKSYEYLSWKDEHYRPRAIEAFQLFLQSYPSEPRHEEAALSLFALKATTIGGARAAAAATLSLYPSFSREDALLLRLGTLLEGADSSARALDAFDDVLRRFPGSPSAEEAAFHRVELLLDVGLPDSAIAEGGVFLSTYPSGPHTATVLAQLANVMLNRGEAERAAELYKQLTSDFSYTTVASGSLRRLGDAYSAGGTYEEAIAVYADLLHQQQTSPLSGGDPDPSLLLALGKAHQYSGSTADAKKFLFEVLAWQRTGRLAGEAYTSLGTIFRSEGAIDVATTYFRQAEKAAPGGPANRDVAALLFENGDYADAIRQFTRLSQSAASDSERQYYDARIIVARLRSDDLGKAEKEIAAFAKKYRGSDDDIASFELERGSYYYRREEYPNALKSFQRVISKYDESPPAPIAMYWIGRTHEAMGKPQEGAGQLTALIRDYPDHPIAQRAYFALGTIYYNAERWDEAIKNYRHVIDDPNPDPSLLPLALSNLIETYETAGINDAALSLTRKYLESYPNSDDALDKKIKIGILYDRLGYYDQAVLHLQSLLDEAGSDLEGEIRYYIAEANYNKGDYQQAILDFLKVPYLVTKKGKIDWTANSLYMSGQSYEKMGRLDQALTMYQQIIDRPGIDETYKIAAKKEIDRVKLVLKKKG